MTGSLITKIASYIIPDARDDAFGLTEAEAEITQNFTMMLDVMANDGGRGISLYSIDEGDCLWDLLCKDGQYRIEDSLLGANIWIQNGKIAYDFEPLLARIAALAEGETLTDSLTYAVRNLLLDSAAATITFVGVNDGPVIAIGAADSADAAFVETDGSLAATGTMTVIDEDLSDSVTATVAGVQISGAVFDEAAALAMLSLSPATLAADAGDVSNLVWSFDSGSEAFDFLAEGQAMTLTYTVSVDDGHGGTDTQLLTVTVTGTSDAPSLPATYDGIDPNDMDDAAPASGDTVITGTDGNDSIDGTARADVIQGLDGRDQISGAGGRDTLFGGNGDDYLFGGLASDILYGQAGNDQINGGTESDTIYGGSGADWIDGDQQGEIAIYGGSGNDTIRGGHGSDVIVGGFGADLIIGRGDDQGDIIRYLDLRDTNDVLELFETGDVIDLSALDANAAEAGDQAFAFGGTLATANGLWTVSEGTDTYLYADTDGDVDSVEFMLTFRDLAAPLTDADVFL